MVTTYYISQTVNGCESIDRFEILILAPLPTVTVDDSVLCLGESTTISVSTNPFLGTVNYLWNSDENETSDSIIISPTESGGGWVDVIFEYQTENGLVCRYFYSIEVAIEIEIPTTDWPDNNVIFCEDNNLTLVDLAAGQTASNAIWYESLESQTPLDLSTPILNGQTYYVSNFDAESGCESARLEMSVTIEPIEIELGENITACNGGVVLLDAGADFESYLWNTGDTTQTILVSEAGSYSVTVNSSSCEGTDNIDVEFTNIQAVTGENEQNFCIEATISDLSVEGENIQWYNAAEGGALLDPEYVLSDGETVYASQTVDNCESQELFAVLVSINESETPMVTGDNIQVFDAEPTISQITVIGENILWYDAPLNGNILEDTFLISDGQTVYASQTIDGCESDELFAVTIQISTDGDDPPIITSQGNEIYCPQTEQNIVTSFNIQDPDDIELDALYVQISQGYVIGEDTLILTGDHPGITTSWSVSEGKLEIAGNGGPALITDIIAAVYDIVFFSPNPNPIDKYFSFTIGNANYLPSTGHYYIYYESLGITWIQANSAAENSTYYGLQGYLATILSAEENQIAAEQTGGTGWIGASDQIVEGEWNWVTGPEAGTNFWNGDFTGNAVDGMYSNWNNDPAEPNQQGDEDYAHITDDSVGLPGSWNDLSNEGPPSGPYQPKGYVVEYGGMPGDPVLNLSSSTSLLSVPNIETTPFDGYDCDEIELIAISDYDDGDVYWYESAAGGEPIFYGTNFYPDISETTSYWVSNFNTGECEDYPRIEISANITPVFSEVVNPNVYVNQVCYTVDELVTDVLINNPCANVSNISFTSGNDFNDVNGIGHFIEPSGTFPFSEGIVLSTGDALLASGPNSGLGNASTGSGQWPGDDDLSALIGEETNNASTIEFDFVPISNNLSFRFIMASEEYDQGSFECFYSDVFAFLLTDSDGNTTNLAVIPETDIPIAVTNIHPANDVCDAVNEEYFHGYTPVGQPDIGYDGRTIAFVAQADVTIGETYHIKLSVADASDTLLDSAVFLEAGSFDLGLYLGDDILVSSGESECEGNPVILDTQIDESNENISFVWTYEGAVISDENSPSLSIFESGNYGVVATLSEDCVLSDEIYVEFYVPIELEPLNDLESCDNFDVDGSGIFDITEQTQNILDQINSENYIINYFETEENAVNNIDPIESLDFYENVTPFNQTIYVSLYEPEYPDCTIITNFNLVTIDPPSFVVPTPLEECDDDYDGIVSFFDLSQKTEEILNGQTGISVSYYETLENAESGENPIEGLYTNIEVDTQTLYVRLVDDESSCITTTELQLIVNPIPTVLVGPAYEVCDDDYDGIGSYDLSTLDETLLDGQTGVSISYYESQEDADNATNVLDVNYQNTVPDNQTLYVRLEVDETGCYATTTQDLIVHPLAVIEVSDYELCDYTNPGDLIEVFDITTKSDEIVNGQDVVLTYFTSLLDSQNNTNPISNEELAAYSNTEPTETIYVTLEQNTTGCITYGSFDIIVNPLPNVIENTDLVQCDIDDVQDGISIYNLEEAAENIVIGDDLNNYVLTFHLSQEDLDAGINAIEEPTAYVNETPLQNIYCRVENINTGCYTTSYFYLETVFNPIPDDAGLVVCDDSEMNGTDADYNGLGLFTLSDADEYVLSLIVANPNNDITDASELTVTYFLTEQDALLELNQLPNEYISEVPNQQVIYLRVERGNDCFGINSMTLEVLPVPSYVDIPDQILCSMTPGFFDIFLSDYDVQVLNGQNPDQYTITYHTSVNDAENGVNALENAYTVVDQVDLFVRVQDNVTGCYISNIDFTLTVEPKPLFTAPDQPIVVCDEDTDGFTTIDISIMTEDIMRGPDGAIIEENIVTYHETAEDMNLGTNAIEDPTAYVNIANPQILYVRIEDDMTPSTGCYGDTTLEIIVETPPVVNEPSNLEYCDPDADGFGVFDLTTANAEIANGLENLVISYHETEADAENNVNAIVGEYNNIVAYEQTVYIRVEDNASDNDCASQLTLTLIVNDVPQISTEPSSLFLCDDNTDGFGIFDLSASSEELLNGLDPSDFTITYYEAEDDAQNGLNAIVTPYNYTNTTAFNQFVWVRIENSATACYNVGSIELIINELPVLTQPSPLNLCDDNNSGDEVEGFTLEDSIGEVLQGQTGINISFHESQEDADNAVNALVSPYNNTANAQTIYVRGEDEITGCYATITLDLRVNPIPSPVAPEPIEECDDDNDGFTFFTLETNEEEIINGELDIILSYYSTLTNAQNDVNPIISPYYNIVPDNQIIYVRAENELTGCFTIVEQELITIFSPEIPLIIEDIVACDDDYDDIALFDLTEREEDILENKALQR